MTLKRPLLFIFLFQLFSCAKVSYLWKQGVGQISLLSNGRDNAEVLSDESVDLKIKDKIRLIEKYKSYFYSYWSREPTGIYSETTILDREAVTYLVIASTFNEIKAKKECFPFMGCFPYLGFFSKKDALIYEKELQTQNWVTYVRPVYAYSTLGYFEDNILSSFFQYNDQDLAEMIFHELFHTIFFINGEVGLNEALATYFSREMLLDYFKVSEEDKKVREEMADKRKKLNETIVMLTKKLNDQYKLAKFVDKKEAQRFFESFMKEEFYPLISKTCKELAFENCYVAKKKWNNASLAAFLTYQKKGVSFRKLQDHLGLDLQKFYSYVETKYQDYKKKRPKHSFSDHLFAPILSK